MKSTPLSRSAIALFVFSTFAVAGLQAQAAGSLLTELAGTWDWVTNTQLVFEANGACRAYQGGRRVNTCQATVLDAGRRLIRITHATGGWIDTVTLSADGRVLTGTNQNGYPLRGDKVAGTSPAAVATSARSLTGAWVHSAASSTQTPDSKVIIVQDGTRITLTQTYKAEGTQGYWVTLACTGPLLNGEMRLRCDWLPGGNPLGFAGDFRITARLSDDGNHLDGTLQGGSGTQETHYSRIP